MKNEIYGYIYMIVNLVNGKRYVGQTTNDLYTRFRGHIRKSRQTSHRTFNMPILKAINKYGEQNFVYGEICTASSQKELNKLESKYIKIYQTNDSKFGYNVQEIDSNGTYRHSLETRKKISHANSFGKKNEVNKANGKKSRGSKRLNSSSKYICVAKRKGGWEASCKINNKRIYLGLYNSEEEAAQARDIAELNYLGDAAILNFPELKQEYLNGTIYPKRKTKQVVLT